MKNIASAHKPEFKQLFFIPRCLAALQLNLSRLALNRRLAQGMTEYVIIVALVAIAAIGVYQLFGQVVRSQTAAMAKELAGEDGSAESQTAQTAAQNAAAQTAAKSLKSFTGNASAGN